MVLFEIYTKETEFTDNKGEQKKLTLKPLSGRYLGKIFNIAKVFEGIPEDQLVQKIDETVIKELHFIVHETLKASYPKEDAGVLDLFTSQNLFKLVEPVIAVNVNNEGA